MPIPLQTDTAAQAAVGQQIGDTAAAIQSTGSMIENEVLSLQAQLVGSTGTATQAKAQRLLEALTALVNEGHTIGEKVNVASTGYLNTDESGAGAVNASAGLAF